MVVARVCVCVHMLGCPVLGLGCSVTWIIGPVLECHFCLHIIVLHDDFETFLLAETECTLTNIVLPSDLIAEQHSEPAQHDSRKLSQDTPASLHERDSIAAHHAYGRTISAHPNWCFRMQPQEHARRSAAQLCCASFWETANSMVSVAQGRRARKLFAKWWSYSPTETNITHFMLKVSSCGSAGGREHRVGSRLIRFSQRASGRPVTKLVIV